MGLGTIEKSRNGRNGISGETVMSAIKKNNNRIICMFRLDLSCKEVVITITRVEKCYKLTRVIDTDVYEQYYARLAQAYNVMVKMIDELK